MIVKPWKHQKDGYVFSNDKKGVLYNWGMGSGKTIGTIYNAKKRNAKKILVIAPKSVLPVWANEIKKFAPNEFTVKEFIKGTVKKKAEQIEYFLKTKTKEKKIVVINYEACWREGLGELRKNRRIIAPGLLKSINWDMIVLDEAHKICRGQSKVSKFCHRLRGSGKFLLALTGTPLPNGCLSAFGLFRFLDPEIFGISEHRFKMKYAIFGGFENREVIQYQNQEDFKEKFASLTHQVRTEDVVELPDFTHINVPCRLSAKAQKVYDEFRDECVFQFSNSEISAENVLVKTLRLAQIASGSVTDDDGNEHLIDTNKIDAVAETIENIDENEPVVVFTRFKSEAKMLSEKLNKLKMSYSMLVGGRNELKEWQDGKTRVLIMNIASGSLGIDCTRARYNLYVSTGYNYAQYDQSLARTRRPGADVNQKVFYYHFNCVGTVDIAVERAMRRKESVIDAILDDLDSFRTQKAA